MEKPDLLIVDSNEVTSKLLRRTLVESSAFATVQIARDLLDAKRLLKPQAGLIILLNMDSLSSLKLSEITSFRQRFPKLLIVLVTWLDPVYYRRAIKAAGADEIFSFLDLPDTLTAYLSARKPDLLPFPAAACEPGCREQNLLLRHSNDSP